jgi:ribokinase
MGVKSSSIPLPQLLPEELFTRLYLITPNETEAGFYTGVEVIDIDSARKAANIFLSKGVQNVVITMGAKGAFFKNSEEALMVDSPEVKAIDTTRD